MLTPYFELSQTDIELFLKIKAPLANVAQTELHVDDETLIFYSKPYYLRLHLPGKVKEDEKTSSGQYSSETGEFVFRVLKSTVGEEFKDLDLIGLLLEPRKKTNPKPEIEVLEEGNANLELKDYEAGEEEEEDDDDEWFVNQIPCEQETPKVDGLRYGFANKTSGLMQELRDEFFEILDLKHEDITTEHDRDLLKRQQENETFLSKTEHYLADLEEPEIPILINDYIPPWEENLKQEDFILKKQKIELTPDEKDILKRLGNREYLLDSDETRAVLFSLVDILFAYAYNHRTTVGENTVESAWTINKLSSTLSWFTSFRSMEEVKKSCVRRSLTYPLYRNFDLSLKVLEDTLNILKLGRRQILKCLLEIHTLFNGSEPRYLLNQLYITDYCIWLQKCHDKRISKLVEMFSNVEISKRNIGFNLEMLDTIANMSEENEGEQLTEAMKRLQPEGKLFENLFKYYPDSSEDSDESDTSSEESSTGESDEDDSDIDSDDLSSENES